MGERVAEFKATKGTRWTPMNDPTSKDECLVFIERRRRAADPFATQYRIRNVKTGEVEEV